MLPNALISQKGNVGNWGRTQDLCHEPTVLTSLRPKSIESCEEELAAQGFKPTSLRQRGFCGGHETTTTTTKNYIINFNTYIICNGKKYWCRKCSKTTRMLERNNFFVEKKYE